MKKRHINRIMLFAAALTMVFVIPGNVLAVKKSSDGVVTLKLAHVNPPGSPTDLAANKLKDLVAKGTNGKVEIKIFPSEQLGSEKAALDGVVLGTIDSSLNDAGYVAGLYPPMGVLDFPYTYNGWDHYRKLIDSSVFRDLAEAMEEESKIKILAPFLFGRRMLCSNEEIRTAADADGVKIRTPNSELAMENGRVLGGVPTAVAYSEAYMALKLGVADAAENPFTGIYDMKWYEVTKFLVITEHVWNNEILSVSQRAWDALSPEQQEAFQKAAIEAAVYRMEIQKDLESQRQKELEEFGMKTIVPENLDSFRAISGQLAEKYRTKYSKYDWGGWQDKVKGLGN